MNPPKGYYRKLLGSKFPEVRIAFTYAPIIGCTRVDASPILEILDDSTDPFAKFYSDGIRNGSLAVIVEGGPNQKVWKNNGELFFASKTN